MMPLDSDKAVPAVPISRGQSRASRCSRPTRDAGGPALTPDLALDRVPGDATDHAGRRQLCARLDRLDRGPGDRPEGAVRSHSQRALQGDYRHAPGTLLQGEPAVAHQREVPLLQPVPHQAVGDAIARNVLQRLEGHECGPGPGPEVTVGPRTR